MMKPDFIESRQAQEALENQLTALREKKNKERKQKSGSNNNTQVERVGNVRPPNDKCPVTLKQMGADIYEVRFAAVDQGGKIKKINGDFYEVVVGKDSFGNNITEVREFNKTAESRADNLTTVRKSLSKLRDVINCNVDKPERCLWLTLTYAENMRDVERLYNDLEKFTKRLRYYLKKNGLPPMEYIYCVEPQNRGAWHAHCVIIFSAEKSPFIHNDVMAKIWQHGFTKTKSLKGIKNPGLYLTAYLTDMEFSKAARSGAIKGDGVKVVTTTDKDGKPVTKAIIKGARLPLYPAGMRIFRTSRGVQRPIITKFSEGEAMEAIGDAPLTYERTIHVGENENVYNTINYRTYNRKGKHKPDPPESE
jgi:hypothetical protein